MTIAVPQNGKATVVLLHGAFAASLSWNGVLAELTTKGYPMAAAANPLHWAKTDAEYVGRILKDIDGRIGLDGHSCGGAIITNAVNGNVEALVCVAGFAPDASESSFELAGRYPGSTLGEAEAPPVALSEGAKDLYIHQDKLPAAFAADVPRADAKLMAGTRPWINQAAGGEPSGPPAWKSIPSRFVYCTNDRTISSAALAFMAKRAGARETIAVDGASTSSWCPTRTSSPRSSERAASVH